MKMKKKAVEASSSWRVNDFIGVDFSGSEFAGKSIWVATGKLEDDQIQGKRKILVNDCRRGESLPGSGRRRQRCLEALCRYLEQQKNALVGLDFPFGLPRQLVRDESWESFVFNFPNYYSSPRLFREKCFSEAGKRELKRSTDFECKAPFSPYNLRVYRQTYYGIKDLLHPLLKRGTVCVLPMQKPLWDYPWVVETCPASTLKAANRYLSYKGGGEEKYRERLKILQYLEEAEGLTLPAGRIRETVLQNSSGDALDSIIALCAVSRQKDLTVDKAKWDLEGYTYY